MENMAMRYVAKKRKQQPTKKQFYGFSVKSNFLHAKLEILYIICPANL